MELFPSCLLENQVTYVPPFIPNTQLAAQRFVRYWEARREVFGSEKYTLKMTLSEALKDDLVALGTCVYTLLPHPDLAGRQILFMEPNRHSRKGYTSESMVSFGYDSFS